MHTNPEQNAAKAQAQAALPDAVAPAGRRVRVVLVDDHESLRQMLVFVLKMEGSYEVVGEASGGVEGLRVCRNVHPDVVILDLALPELCGVHLIRLLREESPRVRVLVYSGATDEGLTDAALAEGPDGFVRKEDSLPELRAALAAVSAGGTHLSPKTVRLRGHGRGPGLDGLTGNEVAVLQMISEGRVNKEMAEVLRTTAKQVDHIRQRLMTKLGLHDVAQLTRYAMRNHVGVG